MNVLRDFPLSKRYYLTHPWVFIRHFMDNCKAAYQRVTRGFCYRDCNDAYNYLLKIIPRLLSELFIAPYPLTINEWNSWRIKTMEEFQQLQSPAWEKQHINQYADKLHQAIKEQDVDILQTISSQYLAEEEALLSLRKNMTTEAFQHLLEHYYDLMI